MSVCIKFGVVGPLFKKKWSTKQLNSCPERGIEISELEFNAVVDHFIDKKRADYTKFNKKLTVQVVYNIPYARHYNPLLIINRGFWDLEKFLVIQTALQYKPQLIFYSQVFRKALSKLYIDTICTTAIR